MKQRLTRLPTQVLAAVTMTWLLATALVAGTTGRLSRHRRDRGAITLEQAILAGVLATAAVALGVVIVNAINTHSANIR